MERISFVLLFIGCILAASVANANNCIPTKGEKGHFAQDQGETLLKLEHGMGDFILEAECKVDRIVLPKKYVSLLEAIAVNEDPEYIRVQFRWKVGVTPVPFKSIPVELKMAGGGSIKITLNTGTSALMATQVATDAKVIAKDAKTVAEDAKAIAEDAKAKAGGGGFVSMGTLFGLESPGKEGYGIFIRAGGKIKDLSPQVSFWAAAMVQAYTFELELIGSASYPNGDLWTQELNAYALGMLVWKPVSWVSFSGEVGLGSRAISYPATIPGVYGEIVELNGADNYIKWHPLFAAGLGVSFKVHRRVVVGFLYLLDVTLTKMGVNPTAIDGVPIKTAYAFQQNISIFFKILF